MNWLNTNNLSSNLIRGQNSLLLNLYTECEFNGNI